uniref:Late transcription factor 3-like protein n=1 Tax=Pithovirus LCPAC103 TaxID=2506588 RepID=A0A481Z6W9_9VIRU|nr:MAG: late transcription factor 3-like protein [Pithovirus LCPAC103]
MSKAQKQIVSTNNLEYDSLENCNIEEVHERVLQKIRTKQRQIPDLLTTRQLLETNLNLAKSLVERKYQLSLIGDTDRRIENLRSSQEEEEYLKVVLPLLRAYQLEKRIPRVVSFKYHDGDKVESTTLSTKCIIINKILTIVERYIEVRINKPHIFKETCHDCNQELEDVDSVTGTRICSHCGYEYSTITRLSDGYKSDSGAVNTYSDSTDKPYDDRDNFEKAIDRFQGKQPDKLPLDLENRLDGYFLSIRFPMGRIIIETRTLNARGRREGTNRQMLHDALKNLGLSEYYPDINLIGKKYWGWRLIELSPYKERLLADYDLSQPIFERIPKERKSSLNTEYRLMKHLQLLNIPCCKEDFKMIKTRKIVIEYERIWRIICRECGWKFIKTV